MSTIFQLPDTSYICYYHSVLHSILNESKAGSGPSVFHYRTPLSSNRISNMSHPSYPHINVIHSTSSPPIHPCPVPWCHNCPVNCPYVHCSNPFNMHIPISVPRSSLIPNYLSYPRIKSHHIYTIPFPWLVHDSVKFPVSSKIEPLSCVASKPFSPLLWVYY